MKCQIFLRLLETKENSPLCRFISANRCYNLRSLNLKWGPTVPQIVGYNWKFLTLYVFSTSKSYNLRNIWIWIERGIFLRLMVMREYSPVCRIFVQWNPTIWGINISFWRKVVSIKMQNSLYREWCDIKAKDTFFKLPQFVAFIIVNILQSEESELEWNFKYSSDCWKWKKIPHSVGLLVQIDRTIWGIWI